MQLPHAADLLNGLFSLSCPHVDDSAFQILPVEFEIGPEEEEEDVPGSEESKDSHCSSVPVEEYVDLEEDDNQIGEYLMKSLYIFFEPPGKGHLGSIPIEKPTRHNNDDEAQHGASDYGMQVVDDLSLLTLDEAEGQQEPEYEEVGEEEHDDADGHVEEGCRPAVFEQRQHDGNV